MNKCDLIKWYKTYILVNLINSFIRLKNIKYNKNRLPKL